MTEVREPKTPWNPSKSATARVKNPLPVPTDCRYCGHTVVIKTHEEMYGRDFSDWPWAYGCSKCEATVGMHPFTNIPLGTLANKDLKDARKKCKESFERIWQMDYMDRNKTYQWLAEKMQIPREECHFGWFTEDQCQKAKEFCDTYLGDIKSQVGFLMKQAREKAFKKSRKKS